MVSPSGDKRVMRRTSAKTAQCLALNMSNGERCKAMTADSSGLCIPHRKSTFENQTEAITKCHRCIKVIWADAKAGKPDIQRTRQESCSKAFYVSQGDKRQWMRDVCFWEKEVLFTDLSDPDVVMRELEGVARKTGIAFSKASRYQADEGGVLTPDFIRMSNQYHSQLKTLYLLQRGVVAGPGGNLTNARQIAPPSSGGAKAKEDLLSALFGADDGYEEVRSTTKATVTQGDKSVTVEKQSVARPAAPSGTGAGSSSGGGGVQGQGVPMDADFVEHEEPDA